MGHGFPTAKCLNPTSSGAGGTPRRVLVLMDQIVVAEVINLTLNHGVYATRGAKNVAQAMALVAEWQPHLAVIDMDIAGDRFLTQVAGSEADVAVRSQCWH